MDALADVCPLCRALCNTHHPLTKCRAKESEDIVYFHQRRTTSLEDNTPSEITQSRSSQASAHTAISIAIFPCGL